MPSGVPRGHAPVVLLPPIRDELILFEAAAHADGSPAWMLQDPVSNRFHRIGWLEFELLLNWAGNDQDSLIRTVNQQTPLNVTREDVQALLRFLSDNQLLRIVGKSDVTRAVARTKSMEHTVLLTMLHNYLFFRVPLLRPQAWLAALQPWLLRLNMTWVGYGVLSVLLLGLFLVSRQWDTFTHTLLDSMTISGMMGYVVALLVAKAVHELGHALTAARYGIRVAHMGVAFLVMLPMLYTDTSESWRLKNPRHRLTIAIAGIAVELVLASVATLAWALASDGAFRNGLFFLATTSWVLTLAINASPFMRFDGYFILSDLLDMPNLHERSGGLARVWIRRFLLGFQDDWPECMNDGKRRALVAFALATWIYRLVVFLGIALLVYHFFFKVLGMVLMLVELVWFIGRPVARELETWRKRRMEIPRRHRRWWIALLLTLGSIVWMPLNSRIGGYGWYHAHEQFLIHSPFPARVVTMPGQSQFRKGDVMFVLESEGLGIAQAKARQLAQARDRQIDGLVGLPDGEGQRQSLESQRAYFEAQARQSEVDRSRLILRAPFDGELRDLDATLAAGVWVNPSQALAVLVDPRRWVVDAFVKEQDLERLQVGQQVRLRLVADPGSLAMGRVQSIDVSRTLALPAPMLDAQNGGPLVTVSAPTKDAAARAPSLRDALFRIRIELESGFQLTQQAVVQVDIEGDGRSMAAAVFRMIAAVLVRESGF